MLKFNKVLLASDFDNTLVYTQGALERGEDIPPMTAASTCCTPMTLSATTSI